MSSNHRGSMYFSLETDLELVERISAVTGFHTIRRGTDLDEYAWERCRFQRKLIERTTDKPPMPSSAR